jgi:hypothetical protein
MDNPFSDPDVVIVRYTRAQAIEDGVLVDVTAQASRRQMFGGFNIPVAVTRSVWALIDAPPDCDEDTRRRAHDVFWMARLAQRDLAREGRDREPFIVPLGNRDVHMWVHVGPGDDGKPVATIMLEGED